MRRFPLLTLSLAVFLLLGSCAAPKDPDGMLAAPLGGPAREVLETPPADMLGLPAYARTGEDISVETTREAAP
ncbi:hypothetical protein DPQ33_04540 [Oceanidesulfovibrio indonesiensis]|uniref:Argininosuccinate lyase n=1 Tax=Oceanidesulfovibrio indonesiensis TaxID=54767 RepID=A0A7M3MGZ0_9BACT|nr:hypothetical protein [Oceanidesulfovibrio indonesiensis]TVM18745.1 hypothetical protein DPQ33_04540 [Oceanidesulfovibrio indonesiensis]